MQRLLLTVMVVFAVMSQGYSQESDSETMTSQIELLSLKLQLAEEQLEKLQDECEALRRENAKLKQAEGNEDVPTKDQFATGVVWAGVSTVFGNQKTSRWALSISKRDGEKLEGGVATESPSGEKIEFPVTGKAPRSGDGLIVLETPMIGRAKLFMRGTVRNGGIALAFSGTNPLGKKMFGSATLAPKN
ncbi:hypothetical protein [Neorhodopirellula pilleata]|uniref:Uncharacterized protein n=1 Tax=Neorhodopirellula pilleata TaxID=2714738 RepID=A0A5C6AUB9_9BACT|nr:hypothetical protein [Neorhodopirellula pilleata]TWU01764.1 hypothetical protein Pla100_15000 [Neorhodopirellula pilleata]